jgi:hypothetical protein
MAINDLTLGDSITLEFTLDEDITGWKIRIEIWDNSNHSIKLATANVTGGADTQVKITDATNGKFEMYVPKGATTSMDKRCKMEIEVETTNTVGGSVEKVTIHKDEIIFDEEEIDWESVE